MTSNFPPGGPHSVAESQGKGALRVESRPISSLRCDPNNARRHDPPNLAAIRASLQRFGQQKPIVVTADGRVVAGNGTLEAARALGWSEIDVVVTDLDGAAATAYALADNRTAELAEWDDEALQAALREVAAHADLLDATGFDVGDIEIEIDEDLDAEPQVERADELQAIWKTELSQLWQLGAHRLLCGDSTVREDVERVIGEDAPTLMVTDPPYGVSYDATWRGDAGHATMGRNRTGKVVADDRADWTEAWMLFSGDVAYVWHGGLHSSTVAKSLEDSGFNLRSQIIWNKSVMVMGRGDYHWKHEPCWYAVRNGKAGRWAAGRDQTTVWDLASPIHIMSGSSEEKTAHPTQKPVECMARPIRNHDAPTVYDPFSGSGTTIMACEQLGRRCRAIEIAPAYVAVALQRWADATGKTPELLT